MRLLRTGLPAVAAALLSLLLVSSAHAADGDVQLTARLADRDVADFSGGSPLVLRPAEELAVDVRMQNTADEPVEVRYVRLDGRVLGMTFFSYSVRVDVQLEPGDEDARTFSLDVSDLGDQATGKLPGRLVLLDPEREVLAAEAVPVDVQGSLTSAYGIFSLLVGITTALLLVAALTRLALGRLTEHRWFRATRFAVPGIGVGLTLSFTLSALGVLVPHPGRSITLAVGGGLVGLLFGFLTPTPTPTPTPEPTAASPEAAPSPVIDLDAPAERPEVTRPPAAAPPPRVPGAQTSRDSV
jgi:hypothetical protein